ncbi:SRPBCC family protein [Agrococcus beijingensis]|uniref:SRPBCC family protein n=1 Tax=Agrococcus beijingensis TaxID=3068634 RepID=UPI0027410361|nr:SRPBCC family protein [Agrococcus sp. REN33]
MQVDEQFEVQASRAQVFDLWTSFERFPEFMSGVESVYAETKERLRWRVAMQGIESSFYAVITEFEPDSRIAWVSVDQSSLGWWIDLEEIAPDRTCVMVRVIASPREGVGSSLDAIALDELKIRCDLQHFRALAEGALARAA